MTTSLIALNMQAGFEVMQDLFSLLAVVCPILKRWSCNIIEAKAWDLEVLWAMSEVTNKSSIGELMLKWERLVYPLSTPSCLTHQVSTLVGLWGHLCEGLTDKEEVVEALTALLPQALLVVAANHFGYSQCWWWDQTEKDYQDDAPTEQQLQLTASISTARGTLLSIMRHGCEGIGMKHPNESLRIWPLAFHAFDSVMGQDTNAAGVAVWDQEGVQDYAESLVLRTIDSFYPVPKELSEDGIRKLVSHAPSPFPQRPPSPNRTMTDPHANNPNRKASNPPASHI